MTLHVALDILVLLGNLLGNPFHLRHVCHFQQAKKGPVCHTQLPCHPRCSQLANTLVGTVCYFLKAQPYVYHDCDPGSMEVSEWYSIHVWYAMTVQ